MPCWGGFSALPGADGAGGDTELGGHCDAAQAGLETSFFKGCSQAVAIQKEGVRNHPYGPDHQMAKRAQKGPLPPTIALLPVLLELRFVTRLRSLAAARYRRSYLLAFWWRAPHSFYWLSGPV